MTRPRVLLVFPTSWDLRELPRLAERWDVVLGGPKDADCPWDLDVPALVEALCDEHRGRIDAVVSASDYPGAIAAAAIAKELGLPGADPHAVLLASHKHQSRLVQARAVPDAVPRFALVDPDHPSPGDVGYPCFVKPVKGAFSVATRLVRDEADLRAFLSSRAVAEFRRDYSIMFDALVARHGDPGWASGSWFLAEAPMSGAQVTVEGWVRGDRSGVLGTVDSVRDARTGSFLRFDHPTPLPPDARARLEDVALRAVRALGLDQTLWNVELFLGDDGRPWLIEVNPRMVAQYADLYEKVDGVSGYEAALAIACGEDPPARRQGSSAAASSIPLRVFDRCRVARAPQGEDVRAAEALFPGTRVMVECTAGQDLSDFDTLEDGASFRHGVINVGGRDAREAASRGEAVAERLGFRFEPVASAAPSADPSFDRPVAAGDRLLALDVVRGVALLGILLVNIAGHALPMADSLAPADLPLAPLGDRVAWSAVRLVAQLKFLTLFSLLFGAGLAAMHARAAAAGRPFTETALRRLGVLGLAGLAHGLFLWWGDVLFVYAVAGFAMLFLLGLRVRGLVVSGAALVALGVMLSTGFGALQPMVSRLPPPSAPAAASSGAAVDAMARAGWDPGQPAWREAEVRAYREGPAMDAFAFRAAAFSFASIAAILCYGWRVLGLFVLGAALWRGGFFAAARARLHARLLAWGLALGLPVEAASAAMTVVGADDHPAGAALAAFLHETGSLGMAAAYLAGLTLLAHSARLPGTLALFAACGRMPLTNYLAQTVLAAAIFRGWGLGLFGQLSLPALLLVALGLFALQLAASAWWMRRFALGPLEWLWRAATYGRAPRMRR